MRPALETKSTIQLLSESNQFYAICIDNEGNYAYINKRYQERFSFINTDMAGQPYHITMHPDDRTICQEVGFMCYKHPGKLFPATIRKHDGRGGFIITQWDFTLMEVDDAPKGVFCIGYDITDFTRVSNHVDRLHQDRQYQNEVMNEIIFNQSHRVRSPLTNIMGLVQNLKENQTQVDSAVLLDMLEKSALQLDQVVREIIEKADRLGSAPESSLRFA